MDFQNQTVFISHSSDNSEIAEQLTNLLRNIGISGDQIFCSSVLGQGVDNGEKLNDTIHNSLKSAKVIIYILSDAFLRSSYCLEELGVGWFGSFDNKVKCYYLRLLDFEMQELSGFVNSKIDKFSTISEFDDIILFIENISEEMCLKQQKVSALSSYTKAFINAITYNCLKSIEEKKKKIALLEQSKEEIVLVKGKLKDSEKAIESYKQSFEINKAKSHKNSLMIELLTIESSFNVMGMGTIVSREIVLSYKQFWFNMANRYEELLKLLGIEAEDGNMERLLSQLYLVCENYKKAYQHFLNAINILDYITKFNMEFFVEAYPYSIKEIILIYDEKYNNMPEGLRRDFIKDSLNYMKAEEIKKIQDV